MDAEKRSSFKDEIRRALIAHAVTPVFLVTLLCFFSIFFIWRHAIVTDTRRASADLAGDLDRSFSEGEALLDNVTGREIEMDELWRNADQQSLLYDQMYRYRQNCPAAAEFYLVDSLMRVAMSSNKTAVVYPKYGDVYWGVMREVAEHPDQCALYYDTQIRNNVIAGVDTVLCRPVRHRGQISGFALLQYGSQSLQSLINRHSVSGVVINEYGHVVASTIPVFTDSNGRVRKELTGSGSFFTMDGEDYFAASSPAIGGKLTVFALSQITTVQRLAFLGGSFLVLVFFFLILFIYASAKRIAEQKTKTIGQLLTAFEEAGSGNLDYCLDIRSNDEFETIGFSYEKLMGDMKRLIARNKEQAREAILSEIHQLESQFNPHFLYNTLETIRYMAMQDPAATDEMIVWLAGLLRYSVNSSIGSVQLKEDVCYTLNYLKIQKCRFGRAFNFVFEIQPEAARCYVPKLVLEPIIENCIKHGFERTGSLTVQVAAVVEDNRLLITVTDDGAGIPPDQLEKIRGWLRERKTEDGHIGLNNVNRRIWLMYGEDYGLAVDSTENAGTTVKITLPVCDAPTEGGCESNAASAAC